MAAATSVQVIPGVRLNFSKSGVSTTIGGRGLHTTYGRGHARTTIGVPGTGLSYSTTRRSGRGRPSRGLLGRALLSAVSSAMAALAFTDHRPAWALPSVPWVCS